MGRFLVGSSAGARVLFLVGMSFSHWFIFPYRRRCIFAGHVLGLNSLCVIAADMVMVLGCRI